MNTQPKSGQESLLIVDDNPQNLQVLGKLLKENNYKIEFATNGEGALEWIKKKLFDLILLDINMPEMNGFEVCMKIRSDHAFDSIPIIFLSAEGTRESILKGFEIGAQDYITKPFDSRELLSRVKTHLTLKNSLEKVENQNIILEATVAERTEQLRNALSELESLNIKLLEIDKTKSDFLQLISHEIRTPLNGIIGPLELLKESGAVKEVGDLIEILDISVKRLEKFSLNALLITRLRTRQDIRKEDIALEEIIAKVLKQNSEIINTHKLSVNFNNKSTRSHVKGESELVGICIENILLNAISYSHDNSAIEILLNNEEDKTVCEIKDHGTGFKNDQNNVFEMFTTDEAKHDSNLGIGLPICKLIMERHSGDIKIGNNQEGGAFVKLSFQQ